MTDFQHIHFFHFLMQYNAKERLDDLPFSWSFCLRPRNGYTPLTYAIHWGQPSTIFWLINQAKVDLNEVDPEGRVPLTEVICKADLFPTIVHEFIKRGANAKLTDLLLLIRRMHKGSFSIYCKPSVELLLNKFGYKTPDFFQLSYQQQKQQIRQRIRNQNRRKK